MFCMMLHVPRIQLLLFAAFVAILIVTTVTMTGSWMGQMPKQSFQEIIPSHVKDCVNDSVYRQTNVAAISYDRFRANSLLKYDRWKETGPQRAASFQYMFQHNVWVGDNADGRKSGVGSTWEATAHIRETLDSVIEYIKQASGKERITMLDAPCGDMFWMSKFLENRDDVEYTGVDIVPELIQSHKAKYPRWKFEHKDVVSSPLGASYDLIHTRHMTQHLTNNDTLQVLQHFSDSHSSYLLASTYPDRVQNTDIASVSASRYNQQNLEISPYSLHPPICVHVEASTPGIICYTAFWRLPLKQMTSCKSRSDVKSFSHPFEGWLYYHC